jgi:hypothetical protein
MEATMINAISAKPIQARTAARPVLSDANTTAPSALRMPMIGISGSARYRHPSPHVDPVHRVDEDAPLVTPAECEHRPCCQLRGRHRAAPIVVKRRRRVVKVGLVMRQCRNVVIAVTT